MKVRASEGQFAIEADGHRVRHLPTGRSYSAYPRERAEDVRIDSFNDNGGKETDGDDEYDAEDIAQVALTLLRKKQGG